MNNTQNTAAIAEFEQQAPAARSVGAELIASREAQEVQVAMVAAKRFPRDVYNAYNRIIQDCKRRTLAEKAMYEYPRGGQTVTGPSIHLARAIARSWGNLDSGFKVLEQNAAESTVMAYCWDLETNYRETKVFTVKHVRETKKGAFPLTDSHDIYELIANQSARRERSCILSVIPQDVVDAAVGQCNATLQGDGKMTKEDAVRDIIRRFSEQYGVTKEMLEAYIGRKAEAFTVQSVNRLRGVYTALKDGTASVEQYFDLPAAAPAPSEPQEAPETHAPEEAQVNLSDV
ncbi:MAG: hypothetical protein HFF78_06455 [Oscillospiraceae bacterium]|nr:hypothetical protein [Oscillospiraceae bacterium]